MDYYAYFEVVTIGGKTKIGEDATNKRFGKETFGLKIDITKGEMIIEVVNVDYERFGRMDELINNAGFQIVSPIDEIG